jgi:hypothetical protein
VSSHSQYEPMMPIEAAPSTTVRRRRWPALAVATVLLV